MLQAPLADGDEKLPASVELGRPETQLPATALALAAVRSLVPQVHTGQLRPITVAPAEATVSDIMTREVISLPATMTLEAATDLLLTRHISGAPVVDKEGKPTGIVSKTDLLEAWHEHERYSRRQRDENKPLPKQSGVVVGDIMVPYLLAAPHTCTIALAAALMAFEGVHRLLVLDDSSKMVGIVTSLDVLRWLAQLSGFCLPTPTASSA